MNGLEMKVACRYSGGQWLLLFATLAGCSADQTQGRPSGEDGGPAQEQSPTVAADGVYHVYPGQEIQSALDAAAGDDAHQTVRVHAGSYRPSSPGQAMIWFNARHDGITLEAVGDVLLTAANEELADASSASYPAIVNHVIYFGDGIYRSTVVEGFTISGANGFVTKSDKRGPIETAEGLEKGLFYYLDGGAIKIVGRSYPTLRRVIIRDNITSLCGGGVSIEHQGNRGSAAYFKDCIFRNNRCPATGPAIDVLSGSSVIIENCLFAGNVGNTGMSETLKKYGLSHNWMHGSGALTVFPRSSAQVRNCTFVNNWNGVDDHGSGSTYENSIFWQNSASDGSRPGGPYELDIVDPRTVRGCYAGGTQIDLRGNIDATANRFDAPDPQFDEEYRPRAVDYEGVGYRPVGTKTTKEPDDALHDE
jgi:hypothetical protein